MVAVLLTRCLVVAEHPGPKQLKWLAFAARERTSGCTRAVCSLPPLQPIPSRSHVLPNNPSRACKLFLVRRRQASFRSDTALLALARAATMPSNANNAAPQALIQQERVMVSCPTAGCGSKAGVLPEKGARERCATVRARLIRDSPQSQK